MGDVEKPEAPVVPGAMARRSAPTRLCRAVADIRDLHSQPLDALRLLLVADVLRRLVEEVDGGQLLLALLVENGDSAAAWTTTAQTLQIRNPLTSTDSPREAAALLGGEPDVVLEPSDRVASASIAPRGHRCTLRVGGVTTSAKRARYPLTSGLLDDHDPLALRLVLLRFRHSDPAELSIARLRRADETLHRWRLKMSDWADMPRALPSPADVQAMRSALIGDLDTGSVLTCLHRLEIDHFLASGIKFETFAQLDRVLALDLCHLVPPGRRRCGRHV